ncbi:hypothetical protein [Marinobacter sp. NFXS9]|uniref:hypothetical protein n=1 Tax=Marinobacter sp. NFXS9 TaxID=2818433 RepID=UPI0032DE5D42
MAEEHSDQRLYDMVTHDLAARIRELEQLQPRVQALEHAVTEIRHDFREARQEQQESHRETHSALNAFRRRMDQDKRDTLNALNDNASATTVAITGLTDKVGSMGKKIAFAAGAIWVLMGIGGLMLMFRGQVVNLLSIAIGGPAQ